MQKAPGHSDLSMTMTYTRVYDEEVERALTELRSPLSGIEVHLTVLR